MNSHRQYTYRWVIFLFILCLALSVSAQEELAATMEVLSSGVEVKRVNTANWIPVKVEAIVGVGDEIRTDATGRARITFFADGVETDVQPNSSLVIQTFTGNTETYQIEVDVLLGQTLQRLQRTLNAESSYNINTPGMTLGARGTEFAVRVEEDGRSAMLVSEGSVNADASESEADVPPGFGVRAEEDASLSDVVEADTFEELDAALDGCAATVTTSDDVRLNVRVAPSKDSPRVGTLDAAEITQINARAASVGWYRVAFRGGFGWILASSTVVDKTCAGLRLFPDSQVEDASLYEFIGDPIELELTPAPEATPETGSSS
jgi:hypothetical protein